MLLKPLVRTCNKRFKINPAMLQHQRDSPAHTKQQAEPSPDLNDLFQGLTLQSQEADRTFKRQEATYNFIPIEEPMQRASANTESSMPAYKNAASTTKPKTKKKTKLSTYNATSSTKRHTVPETSNEDWDVSDRFYGLCEWLVRTLW